MNIKKKLSVFMIITTAILLIFSGCANPLIPENESNPGSANAIDSGGKGLLNVNVGENSGSRTILPTTPIFTKYRLEFSGPGTADPVESTEPAFDAVYLDPGEWTVTAYGYADFDSSEVIVADGSGTVTVSAGSEDSLELFISAQQTGGSPGKFEYSLSVPEALNGLVDTFELNYHPYGDASSPVSDTGAITYSGSGFTYSSSADIEPGYYLVRSSVTSTDYSATKMEIVHIYTNMVSSGSFDFAETDIMPLATISGSLEILTMGTAQDESGWTVEAYTSSAYSADSIIGSALTDASSNWSMTVEAQTPAAEIYFRAHGTDDSSDYYDRPVVSASAVNLSSSDITGIALSENIGQITISGTLTYTADGVSGSELDNWTITPYFDNGFYYDTRYNDSATTDATGNWSFTLDESEINSSGPLGFQIRKSTEGIDFYDGSAIAVEYSDISQNLNLEMVTLSGSLSHTIDSSAVTDFSDYIFNVLSNDSEYYSRLGRCYDVDAAGNWSMLVPTASEARDIYIEIDNYVINFAKDFHTSAGTISDSAVTGLLIDLGDSVTVSGTVEVIINEIPQDLTTWNSSQLHFYSSADYSPDAQIGWLHIEAVTGTAEDWSVVLPAQDPAADIYVSFSGSDASMEYYNNIDAGSFTLGTTPLTNQALTAEQGMITVSGTLSGTMNGSALIIAEDEWQISFYTGGPGNSYSSYINTDGSWSCSIPESDTARDFNYGVYSDAQGYSPYTAAGSIDVSNSDISGISISVDLVRISGTLDVTIDGFPQDLSTWDYCSLTFYSSPNAEYFSHIGSAFVTPGSPSTWLAAIPAQSPAIDLYAFFSGRDGSANEYSHIDAGTISSVGTSEITGQALTVDTNIITVSGTLQLTVNGVSTTPDAEDWNLFFYESDEALESIAACNVDSDGSWSFEIADYPSATNLYYEISSESYAYNRPADAQDYILVYNSNITNKVISVDIVEVSGALTAGTDPTGFAAFEEWRCGWSKNLKNLFYCMNSETVDPGSFTIYTEAAESGTETRHIGFHGSYNSGISAVLYQTSIAVGQTAVTGMSIEYSSLQQWGCTASGTISAGSTGADFTDGYQMYLLDSETIAENNVVGCGLINPDGSFTAQLYEDTSAYDVWFYIGGNAGQWFSDTPSSLGGGDTTGLSLSLDDMTSFY